MKSQLREREVLTWLHERISAADWRLLGTTLGLSGDRLREIRANYDDVENRLWMVVHKWLQQAYDTETYGYPSWVSLKKAVDEVHAHNSSER